MDFWSGVIVGVASILLIEFVGIFAGVVMFARYTRKHG